MARFDKSDRKHTEISKGERDFEVFKREFTRWQERFGLTGYSVYFRHEPLDDRFASLITNQETRACTASLSSDVPKDHRKEQNVALSAKHEVIHLLLSRLSDCGRWRWSTENDLREAEEELVVKLETLIGGDK